MPEQLGFFGETFGPKQQNVAARVSDEERRLVSRLPNWIRLGTSSWTFPGWDGIVYDGKPTREALIQSGLRAYSEHPLFRTVGIDRSYYGPLTEMDLERYTSQLRDTRGEAHDSFRCVSKMWDEITTFVFPNHPRFGDRAGKKNAYFLDVKRTLEVLEPFEHFPFRGPFVFELSPVNVDAIGDGSEHRSAIDRLLSALPKTFQYTFEVRNRELLTRSYFDLLRHHGAAHLFNMWTGMPTVGDQLSMPGSLTANFVVARLMLPPRTRYEQIKDAYAPFNRIVRAQPEMRDDVVDLARACLDRGSELYVIVDNKAEGSAPLSAIELAKRLCVLE